MLADSRPALAGHILLQISKTNGGLFDEALVYHDGALIEGDKAIMRKIMPCRFIEYKCPLPGSVLGLERFRLFSKLMFARYEMFGWLAEFETVTWLDTDILIQGEIGGILSEAGKTGLAMIREDPRNKTAESASTMRACFKTLFSEYDLDAYLYCSGTIAMSRKINRNRDYAGWCYEKTAEWAENLDLPDQGVLNALIQEFGIPVSALNGSAYCCYPSYKRDTGDAKIIHAWGANKFWNDWYLNLEYPQWRDYYDKWLALGGSRLGFGQAPCVSVVIPAYKPDLAAFKACIDSLINQAQDHGQRFSDFEIIIVAEPYGADAIREFAAKYGDRRITLVFNEDRAGIAASINEGIRLAKGKYIARLDDDDIAAEKRLYKQSCLLSDSSATLVTSDFHYFGDMNQYRVTFEGEMAKAWSIFTCPFDHPTVMFRRDFFVENELFYDESRCFVEDWELWLRAFGKGMEVACIHEELTYHRWRSGGGAGQADSTASMMDELAQRNFARLGVTLTLAEARDIRPWNGLLAGDRLENARTVFERALRANAELRLYDQQSLERAFGLRLEEARTGAMPEIWRDLDASDSLGIWQAPNLPADAGAVSMSKLTSRFRNRLKTRLKRLLWPLYRPFRWRYEDRLIRIEQAASSMRALPGALEQLRAENRRLQSGINETLGRSAAQIEDMRHAVDSLAGIVGMLPNMMSGQASELSGRLQRGIDGINENVNWLFKEMSEQASAQRGQLQSSVDAANENVNQLFKKMFEHVSSTGDSARTQIGNAASLIEQSAQQRMALLGHAFDLQRTDFAVKKKILLLGTPGHSNIGDAAIAAGEYEFIKRYFPDYALVEVGAYHIDAQYSYIMSITGADDMIFMHGGGNLGDLYIAEEVLRRRVVDDFPNNLIAILPQTIYFGDAAQSRRELEISSETYNRHRELIMFTRGTASLAFARKHFQNVKSFDGLDMALMLRREFNYKRAGIMACIRDAEDESGIGDSARESIYAAAGRFDPCFERTNNLYYQNISPQMRSTAVNGELKKFARHKAVVTDRLHGMLFAAITNTPCVAISAKTQKISEFFAYFADSNAVFFIDKDMSALEPAIEAALAVKTPEYPVLKRRMFDEMHEIIRSKGAGNGQD
jgi:pyruvyl transferase EpsI